MIDWMCFWLFKDSGCDFKRSELLYCFIQNLAGVITLAIEKFKKLKMYAQKFQNKVKSQKGWCNKPSKLQF